MMLDRHVFSVLPVNVHGMPSPRASHQGTPEKRGVKKRIHYGESRERVIALLHISKQPPWRQNTDKAWGQPQRKIVIFQGLVIYFVSGNNWDLGRTLVSNTCKKKMRLGYRGDKHWVFIHRGGQKRLTQELRASGLNLQVSSPLGSPLPNNQRSLLSILPSKPRRPTDWPASQSVDPDLTVR